MAFAAAAPSASTQASHASSLAEGDSTRILLRWLVGLRWAVFALLGVTLPIGERLLDFHVKYEVALPVLGLVTVFNAFTQRRLLRAQVSEREVALGVAIDLVGIGAILAASGGAANPLSAVFFVHVALAASLLPARATFSLAALAACLFAGLFALPTSGACCPNHPANGAFSTHLYAMWGSFVIASGLVAYFLTRVRSALNDREQEITRLRQHRDEVDRFAALGTLAAGTAHELATPLGTIAVLAGEIDGASPMDAIAHASAISAQVARCRDILTRLQASTTTPRAPAQASAVEAISLAVETWKKAHPAATVRLAAEVDDRVKLPLSAGEIEAALGALLDNALHAMGPVDAPILVGVARADGALVVRVEDAGSGVAPELIHRLGEPFLSTKEPGEGMGLGLYLVRTLLMHAGGRLDIAPATPRGTRVTMRFVEGLG